MVSNNDNNLENNLLFDKFKILSCLKKNQQSSVYLADHIYLGKKIILKTLDIEHLADKVLLSRFKREAKILAGLDHPNIIKVLDFGSRQNFFYISFEYFESKNLREIIKENKLTGSEKESLIIQLALGLQAAHQNQIVHRDIKPENILIDSKLHLKIADFGLALINDETVLTSPESIVGTPAYMSPEQIRGGKLTNQSDLFSCGIVIYELFTGRNPFLGKDAGQTLNNILNFNTDKILKQAGGLPENIYSLTKNLLRKNLSKRYTSARQILDNFDLEKKSIDEKPIAIKPSVFKKIINFKNIAAAALIIIIFVLFLLQIKKTDKISETTRSDSLKHYSSVKEGLITAAEKDSQPAAPDAGQSSNDLKNNKVVLQPEKSDAAKEEIKYLNISGKLDIECQPWAYVYIDSKKIDSTPLKDQIELPAGKYSLGLIHPEYPLFSKTIQIKANEVTFVKINLDTLVGYFDCKVYPWGDVFVDGSFKGQTPLKKPIHLSDGKHRLIIKNPEFKEFTKYIEIQKNDTMHFKLNFESIADISRSDSI
jgi:serine/threonine-protein kinase